MANSARPSYGIYCLELLDEQVAAISSGGTYISRSCGLSWEIIEEGWIPCGTHFYDDVVISTTSLANPVELADPANPEVVYRLTIGKTIERSSDGGQPWMTEY